MRGSLYASGDLELSRELGFDLVPTDEVRELGIPAVIERVRERVGDARIYVSFDVDFVDPAFAPGTGTPEIGASPAARPRSSCAGSLASTSPAATSSRSIRSTTALARSPPCWRPPSLTSS